MDKSQLAQQVTAIVPAYNEEKNILKILTTLIKCDLISEIICVNDGSTDKTLALAKTLKDKVKIISSKKNYGKGHAIATGIKASKSNIVLFIDADLTKFTCRHVGLLLEPLLSGQADAVVGYLEEIVILGALSGQRAYYKGDLLNYLPAIEKSRYGLEALLNYTFSNKNVQNVSLGNMGHIAKWEKRKNPKDLLDEITKWSIEILTQASKNNIEDFQKNLQSLKEYFLVILNAKDKLEFKQKLNTIFNQKFMELKGVKTINPKKIKKIIQDIINELLLEE